VLKVVVLVKLFAKIIPRCLSLTMVKGDRRSNFCPLSWG
jgi:hypothetical protein